MQCLWMVLHPTASLNRISMELFSSLYPTSVVFPVESITYWFHMNSLSCFPSKPCRPSHLHNRHLHLKSCSHRVLGLRHVVFLAQILLQPVSSQISCLCLDFCCATTLSIWPTDQWRLAFRLTALQPGWFLFHRVPSPHSQIISRIWASVYFFPAGQRAVAQILS